MVKIEIRCPVCNKIGKIEISEDIVKLSSRGIVAVNLGKNQICDHSFIAYLDKNLAVRDCFTTDFEVELPDIDTKKQIEKRDVPSSDTMNIALIKLNIYPITLSYIVRCIFLKKPVLLINDEEFLKIHLENFFKYSFESLCEIDIVITPMKEFIKDKKKYKNRIIIERNNIIKDKGKILVLKKIKVERKIVYKFYDLMESNSSIIVLRNEIYKAFLLCETIIDFIKKFKKNEKIDIMLIIEKIQEAHQVKVDTNYLDFLFEIIKSYFEIDIPIIYKNVLGFL